MVEGRVLSVEAGTLDGYACSPGVSLSGSGRGLKARLGDSGKVIESLVSLSMSPAGDGSPAVAVAIIDVLDCGRPVRRIHTYPRRSPDGRGYVMVVAYSPGDGAVEVLAARGSGGETVIGREQCPWVPLSVEESPEVDRITLGWLLSLAGD